MADQPWKQMFPNPDLDPGFRLDPAGRGRFQVKGFMVDVTMRYLSEGELRVEISASVSLADVVVAQSSMEGDWDEPYVLRDLFDMTLNDVVESARYKVRDINNALDRIDTGQPVRQRKQ